MKVKILLSLLAAATMVGVVGCSNNDGGDTKPIVDKPAEPGQAPALRKGMAPPSGGGGAPAGGPKAAGGGGAQPSPE